MLKVNYDLNACLDCEWKRFIYRLNPEFYSYIDYYSEHLIVDYENIFYIENLIKELDVDNLEDLFKQNWNELDLKKICSTGHCF